MSALLETILGIAGKVLDRLIPDPAQKAEAQMKLLAMAQQGDLAQLEAETKIAIAQLEVNKADAQSNDKFQSRWRPFIGWICGAGLAYQFLAQPLLAWGSGLAHWSVPPVLQLQDLLAVLTGMLGLGGLRTMEKLKDKA